MPHKGKKPIKKTKIIKLKMIKYTDIPSFMISLFILALPWCVYCHVEMLTGQSMLYLPNTGGYVSDFFLYYKEILVLLLAVFLVLFYLGEHIFPDQIRTDTPLHQKKSKTVIVLMALYTAGIILSVIVSYIRKNADTVWFGICTQYEGTVAALSYVVLFLAGYQYFKEERPRKILKAGLFLLIITIVVGTIIEYYYKPIYEIGFIKSLIAPDKYQSIATSLNNENYRGQVTLGMYNSGYLGGLCALILPVSYGFVWKQKKWFIKGLEALLCAGLWFALFVSTSSGALYASILSTMIWLFFVGQGRKERIKACGLVLAVSMGLFGILNLASGGKVFTKVRQTVFHESTSVAEQNLSQSKTQESTQESKQDRFTIEHMQLEHGVLKVMGEKQTFLVSGKSGDNLSQLTITDEKGSAITTRQSGQNLVLSGLEYHVSITINQNILYLDCGYDDSIAFDMTNQGLRLIGLNDYKLSKIPKSSIQGLKRFYPLATGRGYAWVNTLPLLKRCILAGYGSGNFVFYFPQNEVVGLLNTHGSSHFVIDKPHNWYLQIAVEQGMLALIAFLVLLGGLILWMIRSRKNSTVNWLELSLFAGVLAFVITGLVNDSSITVNPIFWILFGAAFEPVCFIHDKEKSNQ